MDVVRLPRTTGQSELITKIQQLNEDSTVHGVIVQLPLDTDEVIDAHLVTNAIDPAKDVDGMTTVNEGRLATGNFTAGFVACTPHGCLKLIQSTGVAIKGARAVVIAEHESTYRLQTSVP